MTDRPVDVVLTETAPYLAYLATESLYAEQPNLWDLGERGRFHTLNDFTLHFQAVASGEGGFASHVAYSKELFEDKGFPQKWLVDAWRVMRETASNHLEDPARAELLRRLDSVVGSP